MKTKNFVILLVFSLGIFSGLKDFHNEQMYLENKIQEQNINNSSLNNKFFTDQLNVIDDKQASNFSSKIQRVSLDYEIGDDETFWVQDYSIESFPANMYEITAEVVSVTNYSYIFVQEDYVNTYSLESISLGQIFDEIYPQAVSIYGQPIDVDQNDRIIILVLPLIDNFDNPNIYIAGLFWDLHEYLPGSNPQSQLYYSEFKDLIYINTKAIDYNKAAGTLVHEFSHLLHYSSDPGEFIWINEGIATFITYQLGFNASDQYRKNENLSFLGDTNTSLTYWNDLISNYGAAYLFTTFLFSQFGNQSISILLKSLYKGIDGINRILESFGYNNSFDEFFRDWTITNFLNYQSPVSNGYPFDIQANVHNNITLNGQTELLQSVVNYGSVYTEITNLPASGTLQINFNGDVGKQQTTNTEKKYQMTLLYLNISLNKWQKEIVLIDVLGQGSFPFELSPDISRLVIIVSSVTGDSSGLERVSKENIVNRYVLRFILTGIALFKGKVSFDPLSQTLNFQDLQIQEENGQFWTNDSILFSNYSIINTRNAEFTSINGSLVYLGNGSFGIVNLKTNLKAGSYQIRFQISNGTLIISGYSDIFVVTIENSITGSNNRLSFVIIVLVLIGIIICFLISFIALTIWFREFRLV
ncbi:MAG: hypothetical protein ACXAC7_13110 [Candidatus Hodarchaeales archaeon]|jgi:hypothetical protein